MEFNFSAYLCSNWNVVCGIVLLTFATHSCEGYNS